MPAALNGNLLFHQRTQAFAEGTEVGFGLESAESPIIGLEAAPLLDVEFVYFLTITLIVLISCSLLYQGKMKTFCRGNL